MIREGGSALTTSLCRSPKYVNNTQALWILAAPQGPRQGLQTYQHTARPQTVPANLRTHDGGPLSPTNAQPEHPP